MNILVVILSLLIATPASALEVVIVGDDYGATTRFTQDAANVITRIQQTEPFASRLGDMTFTVDGRAYDVGCARSTSNSRLIICNRTLAFAKAREAEAEVSQVIVLVNTTSYGGAGGNGLTVCYNGLTTDALPAKTCLHEFGHALGLLMDEYNLYLTNGVVGNKLDRNCYTGTPPASWVGWVKGCKYPNWYRQKVKNPDGSYSDSLMKNQNQASPRFSPSAIAVLNAKLDAAQ